jgi:hypothetical protein
LGSDELLRQNNKNCCCFKMLCACIPITSMCSMITLRAHVACLLVTSCCLFLVDTYMLLLSVQSTYNMGKGTDLLYDWIHKHLSCLQVSVAHHCMFNFLIVWYVLLCSHQMLFTSKYMTHKWSKFLFISLLHICSNPYYTVPQTHWFNFIVLNECLVLF